MAKLTKSDFEASRSEKVQELQRQLNEKNNILKNYQKEHGVLEVFFDRVIDAIKPIAPPKLYVKNQSRSETQTVAVMQNSDWHTGEVQDAAEVEFINEYSPKIQEKRIKKMDEIFMRWLEHMQRGYNINTVHVICTGDMISGDIHHELSVTNAYPVPVQCCEAARMFAESIAYKAQSVHKLVIDYLVPDNHSRLTKKPQMKESGMNSFNYVVAMMAKQYLSEFKNVTFNIHTEIERVIDVNGTKYLVSHGNNIVGWMGVPWYSIERHIGKEAKARQFLIMQDIERAGTIGFNKYIFGHWHTDFNSEFYACSASLSGTSAYDHAQGRFSQPGQPAWLIHGKYGEMNRTNINP